MPDSTAEFFDELGSRGHEPLLEKVSGTVRFDLAHGKETERWFVTVAKGDSPSRTGTSGRTASSRWTGRSSTASRVARRTRRRRLLRGAMTVEGDVRLLVRSSGFFPGPPGSREAHARGLREAHAMSDDLVKILDGNTFVVSDVARRHRGVAHRPDRPLLVRHAVPVDVGADRRTASG